MKHRKSTALLFIILAAALSSSCMFNRSHAPGPASAAEQAQAASRLTSGNLLHTAGVSLALPEGWRLARVSPPSHTRNNLKTVSVIRFSGGKYIGWCGRVKNTNDITPEQTISLFLDQVVPDYDTELEAQVTPPDPDKNKNWYTIHRSYRGVTQETALWPTTGRPTDDTAYFVNFSIPNGYSDELSQEDIEKRDILFSNVRFCAPKLEGRLIPASQLRFLSSGNWWWYADYIQGMQLSTAIDDRPVVVAVYPNYGIKTDQLDTLITTDSPAQPISGQFLINNIPIFTDGVVARSENGSIQAAYSLPESIPNGPWIIQIKIGASPASPAAVSSPAEKSGKFLQPHALPQVKALFERQLFFGWEPESEGEAAE